MTHQSPQQRELDECASKIELHFDALQEQGVMDPNFHVLAPHTIDPANTARQIYIELGTEWDKMLDLTKSAEVQLSEEFAERSIRYGYEALLRDLHRVLGVGLQSNKERDKKGKEVRESDCFSASDSPRSPYAGSEPDDDDDSPHNADSLIKNMNDFHDDFLDK